MLTNKGIPADGKNPRPELHVECRTSPVLHFFFPLLIFALFCRLNNIFCAMARASGDAMVMRQLNLLSGTLHRPHGLTISLGSTERYAAELVLFSSSSRCPFGRHRFLTHSLIIILPVSTRSSFGHSIFLLGNSSYSVTLLTVAPRESQQPGHSFPRLLRETPERVLSSWLHRASHGSGRCFGVLLRR